MTRAHVDVAVVGGGPAGARAAWVLAREGLRVTLVDGSHPREKPCGGGVTGRALRLVGDQLSTPVELIEDIVRVRRAVFRQSGVQAEVVLAQDGDASLVVVSRKMFDSALLQGATRAGATHLRSRVREICREGLRWRLKTAAGEIRADLVIGADGANSLVRRRVLRPFDRSEISIAAGYFLHGVSSDAVDIEFEERPPGYLWSFPRRDHLAVGVCAQADVTTTAALRMLADAWTDRAGLPATVVRRPYSWPIPSLASAMLARQRLSGAGWVLVGDAAGLVDPITREGIFFALLSADLAARAIVDSSRPEQRYEEALGDEILPELHRAAQLKAGFFRPRFTRLLVNGLSRSAAVRAVMADLVAGQQPYRTLAGRLARTLEVRLAWNLLRLKFGVDG